MWVHSESTARTVNKQITRRFVLFQNLITRSGSQSAFVNFGVHGSIVLYRYRGIRNRTIKGSYCTCCTVLLTCELIIQIL